MYGLEASEQPTVRSPFFLGDTHPGLQGTRLDRLGTGSAVLWTNWLFLQLGGRGAEPSYLGSTLEPLILGNSDMAQAGSAASGPSYLIVLWLGYLLLNRKKNYMMGFWLRYLLFAKEKSNIMGFWTNHHGPSGKLGSKEFPVGLPSSLRGAEVWASASWVVYHGVSKNIPYCTIL